MTHALTVLPFIYQQGSLPTAASRYTLEGQCYPGAGTLGRIKTEPAAGSKRGENPGPASVSITTTSDLPVITHSRKSKMFIFGFLSNGCVCIGG